MFVFSLFHHSFDAEGSRRAQYRTVAGSDKSLSTIESASATSTSVAMTTSVAKHLTNSPAAQLASRARHFSAPTAAQRNAMGAYSQPSTMPATPSWISSRGSYTEEGQIFFILHPFIFYSFQSLGYGRTSQHFLVCF